MNSNTTPKKRGRKPLSEEEKAKRLEHKEWLKEQKRADRVAKKTTTARRGVIV